MYSSQNLLSLGQALKEKREDQGLSLEKISEWTKISVHTLQAIEEAQVDQLPVYAYLRGFILAYAKVLGMDEKEIGKELRSLIPQGEVIYLSGVASSSPEAENLIEKDLRLAPVILAISILFILGSILVFTNIIRSYNKDSREEKRLMKEGKIVLGDKEEFAEEQHKEDAQLSNLSDGKKQKEGFVQGMESEDQEKEEKAPLQAVDSSLEIVVKALGNVKVFYREDKGKKKEVSLKEDQFKVLQGRESVFIETDNSDLIYIFHNGKNLGMFGSGGRKKKIFSPKEL